MELRFKSKFARDLRKITDKKTNGAIAKIILQIDSARSIVQIPHLVKLNKYEVLYRIKIKLDQKRDYRMVLSIRKNIVWAERVLHRDVVYEYFRR